MINTAALVAVCFDWASPLMSIFTGLQVVPVQIPILTANWPPQVHQENYKMLFQSFSILIQLTILVKSGKTTQHTKETTR
ncbi:hypothetical protein SCLCIDRAFT_25226 [Scleroderma citrinum Foug A]|uniref:Uncharacterized protein n=1 Tax=Scleroderma citrinum Foug A TaxID=1036808 RepID=A0A0C3E2I9_9AGAM|nr:hypothetical protein SCLCIDRAFT_25226 [Scleroderma citrinum Foug A]